MILGKNKELKAGVSLVTVLLFMLVATIAATATYKWLTSEGRSSASRMQKQMARQSAVAGLDNARAWMTFHANDVGALVKQYMDGNYVPINLDAHLRSLQRPGQNHHVWLVGVNTSGSTYKLKVLSSGEANGGARHSEVAIFNVNGLYQVSLPVQQGTKKKLPFDYAYFGGSYNGAGSLNMTSAIVNGNWYGNPQGIEKKFVVTGDANLTGNNVSIGALACVGGNMAPENNGLSGADVYVGKNFTGNIDISGNAYFGGDVNPSPAGTFHIAGNVTLNGTLQTVQSAKPLNIGGDLCLAEDALVLSKGTNYVFETEGNVWMPGKQNIWYGSVKYSDCTCERVWCNWMGQCQPKTVTSCTSTGKKMEYNGWATYSLLSCAKKDLIADGDHFDKYDKIILGGSGKTAYIKTARPWSKYEELVARTFEEKQDEIIKCNARPGVIAPDANHEYCDNTHPGGTVGPAERWVQYDYSPYPAKNKGDKENLYFSYYMEPGHKDVEIDYFNDTHWIWCNTWTHNMFGTDYCADANPPGVNVWTYYVDGQRFWDGYEGHERKRLNYADGKPTGSPYCTNQTGTGPGKERVKYRPICGVTPWFRSNASTVTSTEPGEKLECAKDVKASCDDIWEKKPGCDGSEYKVDDILVTARSMFEPFASKGCAATITRYDKNLVDKLNRCYDENNNDATKREKNLYNGYLVVKVSGGTNSTNPTGTLNGKFIIIAKDALYTKLPKTSSETSVFLYLEKGANTLNDVTVENYFIYTEGDIGSGNQFNLTGTIYATAESCAGLGKLQSSSITYKQSLVDQLSSAGVICPNDGSICGGTGASGSSGGDPSGSGSGEDEDESSSTGGTDAYYISMAPQLGVTLESQYENNEPIPSGNNQTNLAPSFIVLPRVIYLPDDPFGELQNYYNVIPLNGSTLKKTDVSVSSCIGSVGSLPSVGKLYTGSSLSKGIYTCTAKANGYNDVPFWVVVGDGHRGDLPITFVETDQKIAAGGSKDVHVVIPPNTPSVQLAVRCPVVSTEDDLTYTLDNGLQDGNICTFNVQGDPSGTKTQRLFTVTAKSGATTGSITFQLLSGDGYSIGSPYTSMVYMASLATLVRDPVTPTDITTYCQAHPGDCPPSDQRGDTWPDCDPDETWVEPTGITYGTEIKNNRWTLVVGGAGTLQLSGRNIANCVTIIPTDESNSIDISTISADQADPVHLRASLKALKKTIRLTFVGEVTGDPIISIYTDGTKTDECQYSKSGNDKSCYISAFSGQQVALNINKQTYPDFNYWDCSGVSCPVTDAISDPTYNAFTIKDDNSVIYAHFNESDRHCFFEEFRSGDIQCRSEETEYCIDKCGNSNDATCAGVVDETGTFSKSKWHLISGKLGDIDEVAGSISLRRQGRVNSNPVTVMSTVNAGVQGTLKALFQLPKETFSHNRNTVEISKSGFLLHSNTTGSEYLMLNMFAGQTGYLTAQVCSNNGRCVDGTLADGNGNSALVYASNMVMMSATLGTGGSLSISAFTGNYYGNPDEYGIVFDLNELGSSYSDVAHEFVGFSLADPNFKLYGIGWMSTTYAAECYDTPPIVKCSFAAVATNGVIPTEKKVKPWIGHSGWFESVSCTDSYFYYNGTDLLNCSSSSDEGTSCGGDSLYFALSGAGPHGYTTADTKKEMKTVKATLECTPSSTETAAWATSVDPAHCGPFWTGKIQECTGHVALVSDQTLPVGDLETTVTLDDPVNLRATTLGVEFEEETGIDVEIWLVSENSVWGAMGYASKSVVATSQKASFSVDDAMTVGVEGFDPENVKQIVLKNRGSSALNVKSVVASCKNAVDINSCAAQYENGEWTVLIDVANKEKIGSYGAEAKVDGGTVFEVSKLSSEILWEDGKAKLSQADNPYAENQGKTYNFFASVVNLNGSTASKQCNSVVISQVTRSCSVVGSPKKQGNGLPQFNINISGCPSTGCSYEVYIGDAMLDGYPKNANGSVNIVPDGNGLPLDDDEKPLTSDYAVGTYTYKVKSPDTASYPFTECTAPFTIEAKSNTNNDVRTECKFDNASINQPGANAVFRFSVFEKGIDIRNRDYKLFLGDKEIASGNAGEASNTTADPNPSGVNTAKSGSYVLKVKDDDGVYQTSCTADLQVADIGLTCTNNGKFHIEVGNPCVNNACTYEVKRTYKNSTTTVAGSSTTYLGSGPYNIDFTGYGSYVLYINGEAYKNGAGTGCSVSLSMNKPGFACPTAPGVKIKDPVTFTLGSVTGCDENEEDCSYVVDGTTSYGSGYKNGALNSFTDNSVTAAGKKKYMVSLTNEAGTTSQECEVDYNTGNSGGGHATCTVKNPILVGEKNLTLSISGVNPAPSSDIFIPLICDGKKMVEVKCERTGTCETKNFDAPETAGTYICSFEKDGFSPCATLPTLVVVDPVTCSVTETNVPSGTQITFSGESHSSEAHTCGFKVNGAWLNDNQNQNLSVGTLHTLMTTVTSTTTYSFVCTQGQVPEAKRTCSKKVTVY